MIQHDIEELRKFVAPEFVFGTGAAMLAGQYATNLSIKKALVVSDPALDKLGCPGKIIDTLTSEGVGSVLYTGVTPNPRDQEAMAGAEIYRKEGCDAIEIGRAHV